MRQRRRNFYLPEAPAAPVLPPPPPEPPEPLVGAKAIAEALGITPKQVYRLVEGDTTRRRDADDVPPIRNRPVLGLCADRATLLAWWRRYLGAEVAA